MKAPDRLYAKVRPDGTGVDGETNIYPWRIGAFTELWDNINRERGCGWDTNPWVVVIEFEPHLCNVDQMPEVAG